MASTQQLTRRIKSVSNITKITKAMEMVSASKMRQAQAQALASRHYARKLDEILSKIGANGRVAEHPLLKSHTQNNKQALLVISTDRGLTGSLNTNLFKSLLDFQQQHNADVYTIGRLAKEFAIKSDFNLIAEFGQVSDKVSYHTTTPVAKLLIERLLDGSYQTIHIAYMDFITTLSQKPRITQLLPIQQHLIPQEENLKQINSAKEYLFEPSAKEILDDILPYFVELKIYQSLLEARASEHSARMVAMKSASDNASDLKGSLQLQFNRSRQAQITSELSDIVTASLTVS